LNNTGIGCRKKLHDVLDNCIPEDLMKEMGVVKKRKEFAEKLHADIKDDERKVWTNDMSLVTWANESYLIAREPNVQYCFRKNDGCWYSETSRTYDVEGEDTEQREITITPDYEDLHGPIVKERIKQAGVRLGSILNGLYK